MLWNSPKIQSKGAFSRPSRRASMRLCVTAFAFESRDSEFEFSRPLGKNDDVNKYVVEEVASLVKVCIGRCKILLNTAVGRGENFVSAKQTHARSMILL